MIRFWWMVVGGGLAFGITLFAAYDRQWLWVLVGFPVVWAAAYQVWEQIKVWESGETYSSSVGGVQITRRR